jgi:hypothetical protein
MPIAPRISLAYAAFATLGAAFALTAVNGSFAGGSEKAPSSAAASAGMRRPLAAEFDLQVDQDAAVHGQLWIDVQGQTCVQLATPRVQRIWLGREAMVIYNVAEQRLFRQTLSEKSLPPFLDAVVVSLRPAASSLPKGTALAKRTSGPEGVEETWRYDLGPKEARITLRTLEGPAGTVLTELLDGDGALLRRYRYADRRPDRGLSLPGRIEADYYGKGKLRRAERWLLQWRPAGVAPSSEGACLRITGQPQQSSI